MSDLPGSLNKILRNISIIFSDDHSFAHFWWAKWAISSHCSFYLSKMSDSLTLLTKKEKMSKSKTFLERSAHSLISSERPERITHGGSFVLSDLSNSLTVAHFLWATWAIRLRSLICLERSERIAHSRSFDLSEMSEWANEWWANEQWANERIPSPDTGMAG